MASAPPNRDQVLIHFYRAVVAHADVWRQRMDATTNWAAATSALMITFAFGNEESPHFVLVIALAFQLVFLLMESRRYQMYDLWRRRFRLMNRYLIAPALAGEAGDEGVDGAVREEAESGLRALATDLSHTVPPLTLVSALSYRIRRNYGYLMAVVISAWGLKLEMHPTPARSFEAYIERASVGLLVGEVVLGGVIALSIALVALALTAPSERMRDWRALPSPFVRIRSFGRAARPTSGTSA